MFLKKTALCVHATRSNVDKGHTQPCENITGSAILLQLLSMFTQQQCFIYLFKKKVMYLAKWVDKM